MSRVVTWQSKAPESFLALANDLEFGFGHPLPFSRRKSVKDRTIKSILQVPLVSFFDRSFQVVDPDELVLALGSLDESPTALVADRDRGPFTRFLY